MSDQKQNNLPTKRAVGVSYDAGDIAPIVMLKVAGNEANALLKKVPDGMQIVRDPALLNELYRVPMDAPIGRELFPVMALLLAHVLKIDRDRVAEKSNVVCKEVSV
jgi:type III secretion system FlhB-like substrate exporter